MSFTPISNTQFSRIVCNVVLFALLAGAHVSYGATPAEAAKVNRLLDVSGIAHSTRQILPSIVSGIDSSDQQDVPDTVRAALRDAATQAFRPEPMIERVRARMEALSTRQLDDTLAWLDSALGRRITAMENEAAEPAASARIDAYGKELKQRPPSKNRTRLVDELNRAMGSLELAGSMGEAMVLATVVGLNAAQPPQQQLSIEVLRQKVKADFPQMRKELDEMVIVSTYYSYRSLSDKELESYLTFLTSASGAAYSKASIAGFRDAIAAANDRFMQEIPKALGRQRRT